MKMTLSKNISSRFTFLIILFVAAEVAFGQSQLVSKLQLTETVPAELLATRSIVLYDPQYKQSELEEIQKSFAQIGIDAEMYLEEDVVLAGKDITLAYSNYFVLREIKYLVILDKPTNLYRMVITAFNTKLSLVDTDQAAWVVSNTKLNDLMMTAYRNSWISQKKQNLLINEVPEMNPKVTIITGKRSEFYAIDLKVDELAVPYFNDAATDTAVARFMKENYPFKYKLTQPVIDDLDIRKKGSLYVLCVIHCRASAAKKILGYDMNKSESAYVSTTFPNGVPQLKTITAETPVYKFYAKHINSGNIFLGTKWDADTSIEQALRNYIKGFKAELKLN
jgi:hypothetical protein